MQSKLILTALMLLILSACGSSGGNEDTNSVSTEGKKNYDYIATSVSDAVQKQYQYKKNEKITIKIPSDKSKNNVPVSYEFNPNQAYDGLTSSEYCSFADNAVSLQVTKDGDTNKVYSCYFVASSKGNADYKKFSHRLKFTFIPTCDEGFAHDIQNVCQSFKGSVSVKEGKMFYDPKAKHQYKIDEQFLEAGRLSYFTLIFKNTTVSQYAEIDTNQQICEKDTMTVEQFAHPSLMLDNMNYYRFSCKPKAELAGKNVQMKVVYSEKLKAAVPATKDKPAVPAVFGKRDVVFSIPVKAKSADIATYAKATKTGLDVCASKEDSKKPCDAGDVGQDGNDQKGEVIGYQADSTGQCYIEQLKGGATGKYWQKKNPADPKNKDMHAFNKIFSYYNPNGARNHGVVGSDHINIGVGGVELVPSDTSYAYINQLNKDKHCGKDTWRLPTALEMMNLANLKTDADNKPVGFMDGFSEDVSIDQITPDFTGNQVYGFLTSTFFYQKTSGITPHMVYYHQPNSQSPAAKFSASSVGFKPLTQKGYIRAIAD